MSYLLLFVFLVVVSSNIIPKSMLQSQNWWMKRKGLSFSCTGCGKCCRTTGEVWLDCDELIELTSSLALPVETFLQDYICEVRSNWVKLKDGKDNACIFLADDNKSCSVYANRPTQCRTYPFWPSILKSPLTWNDEVVLPENSSDIGKRWTVDDGGCEGMQLHNSTNNLISTDIIYLNSKLDNLYRKSYPNFHSGDDYKRLLLVTDIMQTVISDTKLWISNEILKNNLIFQSPNIRYRACLSSEYNEIIEKIQFEILALLTSDISMISSTILILPFISQSMPDFMKILGQIEEDVSSLYSKDAPSIEILSYHKDSPSRPMYTSIYLGRLS